MGNVLNALPKSQQGRAKADLQAIWMAATRADAYAAFDRFVTVHAAKYPKTTETLKKDRESLLAFYDFPAEHWQHLRTTDEIDKPPRDLFMKSVFPATSVAPRVLWDAPVSILKTAVDRCARPARRRPVPSRARSSGCKTQPNPCVSHVARACRTAATPARAACVRSGQDDPMRTAHCE